MPNGAVELPGPRVVLGIGPCNGSGAHCVVSGAGIDAEHCALEVRCFSLKHLLTPPPDSSARRPSVSASHPPASQ
jgi:hypothetical protein